MEVFSRKGGSRFLSIEAKTFEFILEGNGVRRVRINELGRDMVRSVAMGRECANKVAGAIEDLIAKPYIESFARSFWVGDTVIILQRCFNAKGKYMSIQEINRGGRKGSIIIPEGRNGVGWSGFGMELRRICIPEVKSGASGPKITPVRWRKGSTGINSYAAAVSATATRAGADNGKLAEINPGDGAKIVQDIQPKIEKVKINIAKINPDSLGKDLGSLQLCMHVQIERGLDGVWGVKHAQIVGPNLGPDWHSYGPNPCNGIKPTETRTSRRFQKPTSKFVWRPKAASKPKSRYIQPGSPPLASTLTALKEPASPSPVPEMASTSTLIPPKPATSSDLDVTTLAPNSGDLIERTWGSASDWILELRDGRRLSIPISLLRPSPNESLKTVYSGRLRNKMDAKGGVGVSDGFSDDDGDDEGESVVGADSEYSMGDGVVACWEGEEEPLVVIPLASEASPEVGEMRGFVAVGDVGAVTAGSPELGEDKSGSSPSKWVLENIVILENSWVLLTRDMRRKSSLY